MPGEGAVGEIGSQVVGGAIGGGLEGAATGAGGIEGGFQSKFDIDSSNALSPNTDTKYVEELSRQAAVDPHGALEGIKDIPEEPSVEIPQPDAPPTIGDTPEGAKLAALGTQLKTAEAQIGDAANQDDTQKPPEDATVQNQQDPEAGAAGNGAQEPPKDPPTAEGDAEPQPGDEGSEDQDTASSGTGKPTDASETDAPTPEGEHPDPLSLDNPEEPTPPKETPNLDRRNELSQKVLNNTATDEERAEFGRLNDSTWNNGEIATPPSSDSEPTPPAPDEEAPTPGTTNSESSTEGFVPGLSDADLAELQKQGKMTPEQRAEYKANAVHDAEVKAFAEDPNRPDDALDTETRPEYDARKAAEATPPSEPTTPEDIQKRQDELAQKYKDGTITKEEEKEFKDNRRSKTDRKRLQELEGKDPKDLKDDELDEMQALREKYKTEDNPEEVTDEDAKNEEEFQEIIAKLLRGEQWTAEDVARLKEIDIIKNIQGMGYTAEQAQAEAKRIAERVRNGKPKELEIQREIQERLQQMMAYEIQVINMPARVQSLARRREALTNEIKTMESRIGTPSENQRQVQERLKLNLKKQELNGTIAAIVNARDDIRQLDDDYKDTADFVNTKLGLTKRGFVGTVASRIGRAIRSAEHTAQRELDAAILGYN